MSDYSDLVKQLDNEWANDIVNWDTNRESARAIAALQQQLQALTKDAERYRWLRHGDNDESVIRELDSGEAFLLRNTELDEAIDAAIEASK